MKVMTQMTWRRFASFATASGLASMLAACGVVPYQPAPNEVLAPVKLVGIGSPRMCLDGKMYSLSVDNHQTVKVPVGQRITLGSYMYFDGYSVSFSCMPRLSFTPAAGSSYVSNAGLVDQRCFMELVREDNTRDTGVVPEMTIGPPVACSKSQ